MSPQNGKENQTVSLVSELAFEALNECESRSVGGVSLGFESSNGAGGWSDIRSCGSGV